jgi:hypothetical protein
MPSLVYTSYGGSNLGGGPFNGFSTVQTVRGHRTGEEVGFRRVLTKSWNGVGAVGKAVGNGGQIYNRVVTPFRAVDNSGDFLARWQYACGGPNQIGRYKPGCYIRGSLQSAKNICDGTKIEGASCNPRYVHDSSDYVRYKKLKAMNQTYNELKDGGYTNSSYVNMMQITGGNRNVVP